MEKDFSLSYERISALYIVDRARAIELFKKALGLPVSSSQFSAEQEAIERNRLLMLKYINDVEPNQKYIEAMSEFARSEFSRIRTQFAQSLPVQ